MSWKITWRHSEISWIKASMNTQCLQAWKRITLQTLISQPFPRATFCTSSDSRIRNSKNQINLTIPSLNISSLKNHLSQSSIDSFQTKLIHGSIAAAWTTRRLMRWFSAITLELRRTFEILTRCIHSDQERDKCRFQKSQLLNWHAEKKRKTFNYLSHFSQNAFIFPNTFNQ